MNVWIGSKPDKIRCLRHVCLAPDNGLKADVSARLFRANSVISHRRNRFAAGGINLGADALAIDIGRREFLAGLWGTAVTWPVVAQAQQLRGTTPRIGVLWHASNEQEEAIYLGAFRQGLRDVGHVEGQTDNSRESLRWRAV